MEFLALFTLFGVIFFIALPFILIGISGRVGRLERRLAELEYQLSGEQFSEIVAGRQRDERDEWVTGRGESADETDSRPSRQPPRVAPGVIEPVPTPPEPEATRDVRDAGPEVGASDIDRWWRKVVHWLLGGNTFARVGSVLLFFGMAFLIDHSMREGWLPLEVRLLGAGLAGLILIVVGWRLIGARRGYGLVLQGAGLGIVYLTLFGGAHFELLGSGAALALMVAMVAAGSALAILHDARSLASLSASGGFLAPLLIGEEGNHVALFTYFLVLDLGILAIAWFHSWRELNLLGFVFTFLIGSLWGASAYRPELLATTEPFLLAFFLIFAVLPVLYADRQPFRLRGYVDGTLVFGMPLIGFGLQYALMREVAFAPAFSAVGMGWFYALLAAILWRHNNPALRLLVEAFVGLAIAFGTLAIPLALDPQWTGAVWALEGVALLWIGIRQDRLLPRLSGLALQAAGGISVLVATAEGRVGLPFLDMWFIGVLLVATAGFVSARMLGRPGGTHHPMERGLDGVVFLWGLLWWFGGGIVEIWSHLASANRFPALLAFSTLSAVAALYFRRRLDWSAIEWVALLLLPAMVLTWLATAAPGTPAGHPLAGFALPVWLAAAAVQYVVLARIGPERPVAAWHLATFWVLLAVSAAEFHYWLREVTGVGSAWPLISWPLFAGGALLALPRLVEWVDWPFGRFAFLYRRRAAEPLAWLAIAWTWWTVWHSGEARPLPYLPVLNPLELSQLFVLIVVPMWLREVIGPSSTVLGRPALWAATGFAVLNGMIARSVHAFAGVPLRLDSLWHSGIYQSSISVTWSMVAVSVRPAPHSHGANPSA
jgi:hypothetical protein